MHTEKPTAPIDPRFAFLLEGHRQGIDAPIVVAPPRENAPVSFAVDSVSGDTPADVETRRDLATSLESALND